MNFKEVELIWVRIINLSGLSWKPLLGVDDQDGGPKGAVLEHLPCDLANASLIGCNFWSLAVVVASNVEMPGAILMREYSTACPKMSCRDTPVVVTFYKRQSSRYSQTTKGVSEVMHSAQRSLYKETSWQWTNLSGTYLVRASPRVP